MDRIVPGIVLLFGLLAAACRSAAPPPTPTPISPLSPPRAVVTLDLGPPFSLLPPLPAEEALAERPGEAYGVLDTATGLIQAIDTDVSQRRIDAQGSAGIRPAWCRDVIAVTNADGTPWVIYPDGRIEQTLAEGCGGGKDESVSPDGRWSVTATTSAEPAISINDAGGRAVYRITNAIRAEWSPSGGSTLALIGDLCPGFHLLVFDPASPALRRLAPDAGEIIEYVWRPDGWALAIDLIPADGQQPPFRRVLGLIDVRDGTSRDLISIRRTGELIPIGYNEAGMRLLFVHSGGRGFCESEPSPREPSRLERVG